MDGEARLGSGAAPTVNNIHATQVIMNYFYMLKHPNNHMLYIKLPLLDPTATPDSMFNPHSKVSTATMIFSGVDGDLPLCTEVFDPPMRVPPPTPFLDNFETLIWGLIMHTQTRVCGFDNCNSWISRHCPQRKEALPTSILRSKCLRSLRAWHSSEKMAEQRFDSCIKFMSRDEWRAEVGEQLYALATVQKP